MRAEIAAEGAERPAFDQALWHGAGERHEAGRWQRKAPPPWAKRVGAAIEDRVVVAEVPPGSRFKGYQTYLVQESEKEARRSEARSIRLREPDGYAPNHVSRGSQVMATRGSIREVGQIKSKQKNYSTNDIMAVSTFKIPLKILITAFIRLDEPRVPPRPTTY